jgi:energy-coupling factor transporter ATP-binding protein EcfA2
MHISELPCEATEIIELEPVGSVDWWSPLPTVGAELEAVRAGDDLVLRFAGHAVRAAVVTAGQSSPGRWRLHQGPMQTSVVRFAKDRLQLRVRYWSREIDLQEGVLELGVTDKVIDECREAWGRTLSFQACLDRLRDTFVASDGDPERGSVAVVARGSKRDSLYLVGVGRRATFRKESFGRWRMQKLMGGRQAVQGEVSRLTGCIRFVDATAQGAIRQEADRLFESLSDRQDAFLNLWRTYNTKEWEIAKRAAEEAGPWEYESCDRREDGTWRFRGQANQLWALRAGKVSVEVLDAEASPGVTDARPPGGLDEELVEEAAEGGLLVGPLEAELHARGARAVFSGEVRAVYRGLVIVDPGEANDDRPPERGELRVSLVGQKVKLARRLDAALIIRNKAAPLPTLGVLLEGEAPPVIEPRTYSEISVRRLLRKVMPDQTLNEQQFRAVMLAINTPDIALIQGPPGTGKTTVISAIIACLAEIEGGSGGPEIIIASAQHEAVDNVARKTRTHSLPVVRFNPKGESDSQRDFIAGFQKTLQESVEAGLAALSPNVPLLSVLRRTQEIHALLCATPRAPVETADWLKELFETGTRYLSSELKGALWDRQKALRQSTPAAAPSAQGQLERAIKRLPTSLTAFGDDGPAVAARAHAVLAPTGFLQAAEAELLQEAADAVDASPAAVEALVPRLAALKESLLDRLVVEPATGKPSLDGESMALLGRCLDHLHARLKQGDAGEVGVLAEILDELSSRPSAVEETIQNWTQAVGATVQHVANRRLEAVTEKSRYPTVIIDEAARAHPLDLLVPMVRAGRRIVLVGDHRQLPQMLDPDVERELLGEAADRKTEHVLKDSLFEQLFQTASKSTIPRVVTLNEQYRMHPVLGELVSTTFYPDKERFKSPLPAGRFAHRTTYRNRRDEPVPAAWVDVPPGGEQQEHHSWCRAPEAERVAEHVERLLKDREARSLSIGVISFYGAQVQHIRKALQRRRILSSGEGEAKLANDAEIRGDAPENAGGWERLKIGTVDAFQGREFDIVLLSAVRSNRDPLPSVTEPDDPELERWKRRAFGHLLLENRVNVAMSRQRRLLIVFGDRRQFEGEVRSECVPGLTRFLSICREGRDGIVLA